MDTRNEKNIYALGFFDGVHVGHAALLRQCRSLASQVGCGWGVVTFDTHPDALVLGQAPALLNTPEDRARLLRAQGAGTILSLPFDEAMRQCPWQDFLRMLIARFCAGGIVCGSDFRFGFRGEGTGESLARFCREAGIPCAVVPEQQVDGIRVSSTHIRALLAAGEMETAVRFLGHPHILTGTVISGHHLGRTLGIPTANLAVPQGLAVPRFGVYACQALVDGQHYLAVTNVGVRPTVDGSHLTVEPWLLDYTGDLYGRTLTLEFYQFLRPERKFDSLEALQAEIRKSAEQTRQCFR